MKLPIQTAPVLRTGSTAAVEFGPQVTPSFDLKQMCVVGCKMLPAPMQASCMQACSLL
ncbi:MAG: hypothetical protein WA418_26075 [Bradyrhizobium sp.]